jgi:Spy/CpxP family protein refolding chaperone
MNYFNKITMKKISIIVAVLFGMQPAFAQEPEAKMRAARIGFLTNRVELTPQQAEKFWPLYNQFNDKRENVQIEKRMMHMEMNKNGLTDDEAKKMIEKELKTRQDELNLEKEFIADIQTVLTPVQAIKLLRAERDFNMEVLRNLQQRRNQPNHEGRPGN